MTARGRCKWGRLRSDSDIVPERSYSGLSFIALSLPFCLTVICLETHWSRLLLQSLPAFLANVQRWDDQFWAFLRYPPIGAKHREAQSPVASNSNALTRTSFHPFPSGEGR